MIVSKEWRDWANSAKSYFKRAGAASDASYDFALLYGLAYAYGLSPRITSIWRDPARQKKLQERWDRGDRAGLRARPATNSKHTKTNFWGRPASEAMDMPTNNDKRTAQLARELGMGAGQFFKRVDPGHYFIT